MQRPSGGKRAGDKRRKLKAEQLAADPDFEARALDEYNAATGEAPSDPREAPAYVYRAQMALARFSLANKAAPLSQRIEQASRCLERAGKSVDTAKLRAELDDLLARLNATDDDAAQEHRGEDRGSETAPRH